MFWKNVLKLFLRIWILLKNLVLYFGIKKTKKKIILQGLCRGGKTTLFQLLKLGKFSMLSPSLNIESVICEIKINSITYQIHDLWGLDLLHPYVYFPYQPYYTNCEEVKLDYWKKHSRNTDGVVFILYISDEERIPEAKEILKSILSDTHLSRTPILILGNKNDQKFPRETASENHLRKYFNIDGHFIKNNKENYRNIELFMCSMIKCQGYIEGLNWLTNCIEQKCLGKKMF